MRVDFGLCGFLRKLLTVSVQDNQWCPCLRKSGAPLNIHPSQKTLLTKITHNTHCPPKPSTLEFVHQTISNTFPHPPSRPPQPHPTPIEVPAHVFSGDPQQQQERSAAR